MCLLQTFIVVCHGTSRTLSKDKKLNQHLVCFTIQN